MIVVDTNVIAYLWMPGAQTSMAEKVFAKDPDWIVPVLWRSEFRSVLAGFIRTRGVSLKHAREICHAAEDYFKDREYFVASENVLDVISRSSCSAYDCEFVALAQQHGLKLISFDKDLLKHFSKIVRSPQAFVERY